jgi:A/G-specific adenine glycosylase
VSLEPPGLLAGLHEFPTVPNISGASATAAKVADIPNGLLKDLLVDPPLYLYSGSKPQGRSKLGSGNDREDDDSAEGAMRIVHVKPAGDIVHVFSHIRKTYRVQWVLLKGGGDEPPKLRNKFASSTEAKTKTKVAQKGKPRERSEACEDSEPGKASSTEVARWVPLDQVEHAKYVKTERIPYTKLTTDLTTVSELV